MSQNNNIFCTNCGSEIPANSAFCTSCETKINSGVQFEETPQVPDNVPV